ncbi:uncharacterized protein LOC143175387 isoform X2 [Nomia melanderi]|uniref:uncharacterized protein LOC143175325 isoform X2 n=1 Tax=Nomia melanderi TaxID=2448451 RepID=UPI003FCCC8BC
MTKINAEKFLLKRILTYINDQVREITFADEPIYELTNEEIDRVLEENHDLAAYPGIQKTYNKIKEQFKIPKLMEKVEQKVKECDTCQTEKLTRVRSKEEPVISDTPEQPNDKIAMDILGPLPKTKRAYSTIIHEATGFTPFELTFSQKANLASSVTANSQRTYTKYKLEKENGILNCNMLGKHYRKANKGQPAFSPSPGTSRMD